MDPRFGVGFLDRESQHKTEVAVGAVSVWQSCRLPRSRWTLLPALRPGEQTVPSCLFLLRVGLWGVASRRNPGDVGGGPGVQEEQRCCWASGEQWGWGNIVALHHRVDVSPPRSAVALVLL